MFQRLLARVLYGGRSALGPTETRILEAVLENLPPTDAAALREQVAEIETVQEWGKRVVAIFYRKDQRAALVSDARSDDEWCLAKLRLSDGRRCTVTVWASRGRLRSFEYTRRPAAGFSIDKVEVRPERAVSVSAAMDRLEHGASEPE